MSTYIYKGDRMTAPEFKNMPCSAVKVNGKCIRGRNSNMLVSFNGLKVNVLARLLRKSPNQPIIKC